MKRNLLIFMMAFLIIPLFSAQKLKRLDRKFTIQYSRIYSRLSPAAKSRVARMVKQFENQMIPLSRNKDANSSLNRICSTAGITGMDVSEAAFIVMMMAARDMDDDILILKAKIKAMTDAKQKLRETIKELNQWISKQMASRPGSEQINNQPVSPANRGHKLGIFRVRKLFTPKYRVPYYKPPPVKRIPPLNRLSINQLRRLLRDNTSKFGRTATLTQELSLNLKLLMDRRAKFVQTLSEISRSITSSQTPLINNLK